MIVVADDVTRSPGENENSPVIGWENFVTTASVEADEEAPDHPVTNLANPATHLLWRGTTTGEQHLTTDVGEDPVDYIAVQGHNFGTGGISVSAEGWDGPVTKGINLRLLGTNIGDMTEEDGLVAAFDNDTTEALTVCAVQTGTEAFVGKDFASTPKRVFEAIVSGSDDQGYVNGATPSVTLQLYGSNAAPVDSDDGTLIGTLTPFTDTANESAGRTITSTDQESEFRYIWARVTHNGASAAIAVAELQIFEADQTWVELVPAELPTDDDPLILQFDPQVLLQVRLRMQTGTEIPEAAVMYAGKLLVLQRRIYVGHTPITFGRRTTITNGMSESGQFLGRIVMGQFLVTEVSLQNLTPSWYRANMDPFVQAAREEPFFFAWRPGGYPEEVGYAWLTGDPSPVNSRSNGMMEVQLQMSGVPSGIS